MSYLKGKDIKQKGDCLCNYFSKKIEVFSQNIVTSDKPEGFEKW